MEIALFLVVILGFIGLAVLLVSLQKEQASRPMVDPGMLLMLQQRLDAVGLDMKGSLTEQTRQQQSSSQYMTGTVRDVTERLIKLEETNRQILAFSGQLDQIQRILSNPKQRGILGEYYLETLLRNIFSPEQYEMQYKFKDGLIVDAAVFVQNKVIPVDSKFSLENYNRLVDEQQPEEKLRLEKVFVNDLKTRITETAKYIRPSEGTMEFAFMFIPHEAIYYDLLTNKVGMHGEDSESLIQRAAAKYHVIIVSPTSFSAYLQTVLQGLNALKIEEQAKEIRQRVTDLGRHLQGFEQAFQAVGKHMSTTVNQYNLAGKELAKIDKDVLRIAGQGTGFVQNSVDRPSIEE